MEVMYSHCAGIDVHKKTVVVCCLTQTEQSDKHKEIRTFGTMTSDLLALSAYLTVQGVTHVAMESTGELWKPVYNLLEGNFELLVVNAQHIKHVPGRKTDVKDAEWIAELLQHGLLRSSFIPPQAQRDLRDLTRQRTNLVQDRATVVNRLQKVCEWSNIKLSSVVTDITGVSARAMLAAMAQGQSQAQTLAELAKGQLRHKRSELERALTGLVREHHRFVLAQHLAQIDFLEEQIERYDEQIRQLIAHNTAVQTPPPPPAATSASAPTPDTAADTATSTPTSTALSWEEAVALLDTHPGISRRLAEILLAEIGTDMSRFASAEQLASWAKVCPGNNESAGKRHSASSGHGNRWLRSALVQAAWAAVKVKQAYLCSFYHRLAARRGAKRAIVAVAHRILVAIYHMLSKREPYHDLGATYLDERHQTTLIQRTIKRFAKLGFTVAIVPTA
jgi:transposase